MPEERVLEANASAFVVLDAFPVARGHCLVVSRRHVADIFDLTPTEITDILRLVLSARRRIDGEHRPGGFNVGVNVASAAGQTIMHAHVHVIPRYPGDSADPTGGVRGVIPGKARYR
jgi:diadenosine tetraphosphate (Ap4A) HIT family hydrolase